MTDLRFSVALLVGFFALTLHAAEPVAVASGSDVIEYAVQSGDAISGQKFVILEQESGFPVWTFLFLPPLLAL